MDKTNREEANIIEGDQPWLMRNLVPMIAVAVLVAAVIIGVLAWNLRISAREMEAREAFMQVDKNPEGTIQTAREYLGTQEAAIALLEAASAEYGNRKYEAAVQTYQLYLDNYPKHPLRSGAFLGMGYAQLSLKKTDLATASFQDAAGDEDSVYTPLALIELAQIAGQQGDTDKQVELLTKVSENYATSLYGRQAIMELSSLNRKRKSSGTAAPEDKAEKPAASGS